MSLVPGTPLGPYEIVFQLGGGGMGVVYEARDPRLKRTVAIKLLPPHLTKDATAKQRFLQEAQAASALDHPNIRTIHEINETDDGQLYLVMTHYAGETLEQPVNARRRRSAPPTERRGDLAACGPAPLWMMVDEVAEDRRRVGPRIEDARQRDSVTERPGFGGDRWQGGPRRERARTGFSQRLDQGPAPGLLERIREHAHDRGGCHQVGRREAGAVLDPKARLRLRVVGEECAYRKPRPRYVQWALLRISRRPASLTGHADRLSRLAHRVGLGPSSFSVSPDGTLVYVVGGADSAAVQRFVWVDRNGRSDPIPTIPPGNFGHPRLSPDGERLLVGADGDLWIYDLATGRRSGITRARARDTKLDPRRARD